MPLHAIGQHAQDDVRAHPVLQTMMNRSLLQIDRLIDLKARSMLASDLQLRTHSGASIASDQSSHLEQPMDTGQHADYLRLRGTPCKSSVRRSLQAQQRFAVQATVRAASRRSTLRCCRNC